jgi:hypothetical protein
MSAACNELPDATIQHLENLKSHGVPKDAGTVSGMRREHEWFPRDSKITKSRIFHLSRKTGQPHH